MRRIETCRPAASQPKSLTENHTETEGSHLVRTYCRARQTLEKSFQVPVAVPARFIADHWCPHSSMRVRAAALRLIMSSPDGVADC